MITAKQRANQLCYMSALQKNVLSKICCQKCSDMFFQFDIYAELKKVVTSTMQPEPDMLSILNGKIFS